MNAPTAFIFIFFQEEEGLIRGVYLNVIFFAFGEDIYLFLYFHGKHIFRIKEMICIL